jgi:hypothetical protein
MWYLVTLKLIHKTKPTKFTNLYKCCINIYILNIWLFYTMMAVYKMTNLALGYINEEWLPIGGPLQTEIYRNIQREIII